MVKVLCILSSTQWYKVYQDPEGTRSLAKSDHTDAANNTNFGASSSDETYYKSRIQELNQEIIVLNKKNKSLNDELATVSMLHNPSPRVACFPLVHKRSSQKCQYSIYT